MDILKVLENRNYQTNIFILIILVSLLSLFDLKIIISLSVIILLVLNVNQLSTVGDTTSKIKQDIQKHEIGQDMYYNNNLNKLLHELKEYKKYNRVSYKEGTKCMRKFIKIIHILEHDKIYNYNQYFENAYIYLKDSINHFQSITISLPERTLKDGIKYGDFEATKKTNKLGKLCKDIYNECYNILLNLSIEFNEKWRNDPNIYTREIDMNTFRTEQYNKYDEINWSLY